MGIAHDGKTREWRPSLGRVFLVDDHEGFRKGLCYGLERTSDLMVCGEAGDATAAVAGIARTGPDVAVVDLNLRGK